MMALRPLAWFSMGLGAIVACGRIGFEPSQSQTLLLEAGVAGTSVGGTNGTGGIGGAPGGAGGGSTGGAGNPAMDAGMMPEAGSMALDLRSRTRDTALLYLFNEGSGSTVTDIGDAQWNLDLEIAPGSDVTWGQGTLQVRDVPAITHNGYAVLLRDACIANEAISVEAWVQATEAVQPVNAAEVPARVVTLSENPYQLFAAIVHGDELTAADRYAGRVRVATASIEESAGHPHLYGPNGITTTDLHHLVLVRRPNGEALFYVDGAIASQDTRGGSFADSWLENMKVGLGNELFVEDRRWRGIYHLVAFYTRELSDAEVLANFQAGADPEL